MHLVKNEILPGANPGGVFVARVWMDNPLPGPRPCVVRGSDLWDLSALAPTLSDLFDLPDCAARVRNHSGSFLCSIDEALSDAHLLAPCDLQAIKACGVTFVSSLLERMIEEKAAGTPRSTKDGLPQRENQIGKLITNLMPGSEQANLLKQAMINNGTWSQYLEVGIGPHPEVFTKAQPMSAVGCGAAIGVHPDSNWSVSEPEIVLAVSSGGKIVGASLGNDLTLRDFEGRSALLLGLAKDNNASCAIGPFVRLFDIDFGLTELCHADVELQVSGTDGFTEHGTSCMSEISRTPEDLVAATIGAAHQYPDGLMLFLGTMYVPGNDRHGPGSGFTHKPGDEVRISSTHLGCLINEVVFSDLAPAWTYGVRALTRSLAARGVL